MSNLVDVVDNELIIADTQNLVNSYIEHGTHRINTLSLNIGGTETISSGRIGDFLGLSISNLSGVLKATNGTVSVATLNTDYIKDLSTFTTDNLTEGSTNLYDKTVSLTAGIGISISGTYPNFTITNTGEANSFVAGNGISISESPDDTFTFSVVDAELSITESQISDLKNYFDKDSDTSDSITDTATNRFTNDTDITRLANTSGSNTGDQTLPINSDFNLEDLKDVIKTDKSEGKILKVNSEGKHVYVTDESGTDEKVKYDVSDPTAGYIADKFIAGTGISVAEGTAGNKNKLVITNDDKGSDVNLSGLVPYTGATTNIDLNLKEIENINKLSFTRVSDGIKNLAYISFLGSPDGFRIFQGSTANPITFWTNSIKRLSINNLGNFDFVSGNIETLGTITGSNLSGTNTGDQTLPVNSDFNLADLGDVDDTAKATGKIIQVNSDGNHEYVDLPNPDLSDYMKLDQTTPQTITNGIPLLTGLTPTTDYQISTKKYVDDSIALAIIDSWAGSY